MKEELKQILEEYSYIVEEDLYSIQVKLAPNLYADIKFKDDGKIEIVELFKGWNMLSGILGMSFKSSIIYNTVMFLIVGYMFVFLNLGIVNEGLVSGLLIFLMLVIFWFNYYLIKFENFKYFVINLLNQVAFKHTR
jgi:hypothetical protein